MQLPRTDRNMHSPVSDGGVDGGGGALDSAKEELIVFAPPLEVMGGLDDRRQRRVLADGNSNEDLSAAGQGRQQGKRITREWERRQPLPPKWSKKRQEKRAHTRKQAAIQNYANMHNGHSWRGWLVKEVRGEEARRGGGTTNRKERRGREPTHGKFIGTIAYHWRPRTSSYRNHPCRGGKSRVRGTAPQPPEVLD